jgi:hypothetical protein
MKNITSIATLILNQKLLGSTFKGKTFNSGNYVPKNNNK